MTTAVILVDAGNTRCKLGRWSGDRLRDPSVLALDWSAGDEGWLVALRAWQALPLARPGRVVGVNVAGPGAAERVSRLCARAGWPAPHWWVSQAEAAGVRNPYERPAALGADRWAALIGLAARVNGAADAAPLLLASFGTATTVDLLAPRQATEGVRLFEGGLILPGPRLMAASLAAGTAQLPDQPAARADFPTNTVQAIASGIAAAQAGAVVRQWRLARQRYGHPPRTYVAGGGWPLVAEEMAAALGAVGAGPPDVLDAPVLDGLAVLARVGC